MSLCPNKREAYRATGFCSSPSAGRGAPTGKIHAVADTNGLPAD
jgi:hypothetical protein